MKLKVLEYIASINKKKNFLFILQVKTNSNDLSKK